MHSRKQPPRPRRSLDIPLILTWADDHLNRVGRYPNTSAGSVLSIVRDAGDHLNTHYRSFASPMGLALADGGAKLDIGTTIQVWEFRDNRDAVSARTCFLHHTATNIGSDRLRQRGQPGERRIASRLPFYTE